MPSEFSALQQMGAAGADNGSGYTDELRNALQHVSMTPQQGPQQAPAGPGEAELHNALANMREFQSKLAVQSKQNEQVLPPATIKVNTADGTLDLGKVPIATYEGFMRDRQQLNEIRGAFHQEAERLKQQEDQTRSQPWVQLATALSANLANQPDMPGWVRGLGQTAAQLNPTADQLGARRLHVLNQEAQLAESGTRLNLAAGEAASRELDRQGKTGNKAHDEAVAAENDRRARVEKAGNNLEQAISKGPGEMDPAIVAETLTRANATPEEIKSETARLGMLASNISKKYAQDRADNERKAALDREDTTRRSKVGEATLRLLTAKDEGEKADIEEAARSLAAGELTLLKDISSLRGGQRLAIFRRARELNPKFTTQELQRKVDTEKLYTTGKEGDSLRSFDTFLQHAGELDDTLNGLYQSKSPALNKPLNWIRKNAEGNPEYQRLLVALEPVGKEFEQFLLGGRALYDDDRKQIKEMMNGNSSPAQIRAALNQMGKTAKDRYVAMNHKYKRVMGQDVEHPFSGQATAAANKIGIDLGPQTAPNELSGGAPAQEVTATGANGEKYVLRNGAWVKR